MKTKKLIAVAAAGVIAASVGGFVACGDKTPEKPETPTEAKIVYQFGGHYTDDTLKSMGFDYYILLNLFDDGKVKGSGYNQLAMDSSPYASNKAFSEKWYTGSWMDAKNDEDMDYIDLKVRYDSQAINNQTGQQLVGDFTYELYAAGDGSIKFTIDVPFASGRKQEITGGKTVKYKTLDEFIQGNLYTWTAPESVAVFVSEAPNGVANLYCKDNGDALFYTGTKDPAKNEYKYINADTWKWQNSNGKLTFKKDGDVVGTADIENNRASFSFTKNLMGYETEYSFACADTSKLVGGAQEEEDRPIATFAGAGGATLKVFADGTAKLSAYGGMIKPEFTWEFKSGEIIFTDKENAEKKYTATVTGNAATVTYSDSLGGNPINIELSCDDIKGVLAISPIATFTGAGGATLEFYSDNTAKASFFNGAMKIDFTWTLSDGAVTLTDAVNTEKTYTSVAADSAVTLTIKDGYASDTFTLDLSLLG